jgi:hypothetical protein
MSEQTVGRRFAALPKRYFYPGLTLFLAGLIFTPVFFLAIFRKTANDYRLHLSWARQIGTEPQKIPGYEISHSLWHLLVFIVHSITFSPYKVAGFLVTLGSVVLAAWLVYHEFQRIAEKAGWAKGWAVALSLGVVLANPISLLAVADRQFYLGYLAMNSYHNPTILLLKPIALLQFTVIVRSFLQERVSWKAVGLAALLSLLSAYAKPSFTVCILPAVGLLAVWRWFTKQSIPWKLVIWGVCVPSALALAGQYFVTYLGAQDAHVIFDPLGVMQLYSGYLLPKFLLSILFPLLATAVYWKQAQRSPGMITAWGAFAAGAAYTYFMAEGGIRFRDGNFAWSGEIASLVLFFAATVFCLENLAKGGSLKGTAQKALAGIWGLHVLFGVAYLLVCTLTNNYY